MKFVCDHMLIRLGKWLRAAGYDVLVATSIMTDKQVLELALADQRILLSGDRHFLKIKNAQPVLYYFKTLLLTDCIFSLNHAFQINWLKAPFSRCLECNTLVSVISHQEANLCHSFIDSDFQPLWKCSTCQRTYWEGSHTKRMHQQLQQWQDFY